MPCLAGFSHTKAAANKRKTRAKKSKVGARVVSVRKAGHKAKYKVCYDGARKHKAPKRHKARKTRKHK